jgi:membrane-bound ClpP family serine protease
MRHLALILDLRPPDAAVHAHLVLLAQTSGGLEAAVGALADPNVAYLLLVLGFLGLFLELSTPGASIPGPLGVISLILAAVGLSQLPFDWRGALLILVAFSLFFADVFVPSLGLLTLSGLALLVAGSYVLFDEAQGVFVNRALIWAIAVSLVGIFVVIGGFALSVWRRKPATGREGLVGAVGTVRRLRLRRTVAGDRPWRQRRGRAADSGAGAGDRHRYGWPQTLRPSRYRGRGRGRWRRRDR